MAQLWVVPTKGLKGQESQGHPNLTRTSQCHAKTCKATGNAKQFVRSTEDSPLISSEFRRASIASSSGIKTSCASVALKVPPLDYFN